MSTTNRDREVYLAFLRKTEHKAQPWLRDTRDYDNGPPGGALFGMWLGIVVLACLIGYGIVAHVTDEPSWTQQVVEECERQGKVPHVERAADGHVLGVRCDSSPVDMKP